MHLISQLCWVCVCVSLLLCSNLLQVVTGYMTSVLMTFVMLSILNMCDVLSTKALSNLPTTTFMNQEEVREEKRADRLMDWLTD